LIPHAFSLAELAGRMLASNKKEKAKSTNTTDFDTASLLARIEVLENNELKQAALIQQMAQQNLTLIKKAEKNYKLAIAGIGTAAFSIVLSILFIFLSLE